MQEPVSTKKVTPESEEKKVASVEPEKEDEVATDDDIYIFDDNKPSSSSSSSKVKPPQPQTQTHMQMPSFSSTTSGEPFSSTTSGEPFSSTTSGEPKQHSEQDDLAYAMQLQMQEEQSSGNSMGGSNSFGGGVGGGGRGGGGMDLTPKQQQEIQSFMMSHPQFMQKFMAAQQNPYGADMQKLATEHPEELQQLHNIIQGGGSSQGGLMQSSGRGRGFGPSFPSGGGGGGGGGFSMFQG